jgi:hypothetical protein
MNALSSMANGIGSLFGAANKIKMPKTPKPIAAVEPDSAEAKAAAMKRARDRAALGRQGTIYSQAYSGSTMGGS